MSRMPFYITISAVSGDPNGLRVVEHSAWYGKALIFPRALLPELLGKRDEFQRSAVYLLLGQREDGGGEMLYIGEADPIGDRLQNHHANKDFWNRAIIVTGSGDQLNKSHVKFLEARLVQLAQEAKRIPLENKTNPTLPSLSESERIKSEGFLAHLLEMLPLLGVSAFERHYVSIPLDANQNVSTEAVSGQPLVLRAQTLEARGFETSAGFVVSQGSQAKLETTDSMEKGVPAYFQLRQDLIESGVLSPSGEAFVFSQDYAFDSSSAAAAIIRGRSANGRLEWKSPEGKSLKLMQEESARARIGGQA